jgi:glutamate-1-semialdehyde 2,1-aminomutase
MFAAYFQSMLSQGIYLAPSQFESLFISLAVEKHHIDQILTANETALMAVRGVREA